MKVKVNDGWQLGLEGESVYQPGETFDAPDDLAKQWIAAGQAVAVKAVTSSPNKAVASSPNKAFSAPAVKPASSFTGLPTVKK